MRFSKHEAQLCHMLQVPFYPRMFYPGWRAFPNAWPGKNSSFLILPGTRLETSAIKGSTPDQRRIAGWQTGKGANLSLFGGAI